MKKVLIEAKNLTKEYGKNESLIYALKDVNFKIYQGELLVILGASGAGKSTLINILGGMDRPTSGSFIFNEKDISKYSNRKLSLFRREEIGFVFQFYSLIESLSALENVEIASKLVKSKLSSKELLDQVGLSHRLNNFPSQLSGGEQQRVAIARALAKEPHLLLCDEPTGALDIKTGQEVLKLIQSTSKEQNRATVIVTHNQEISKIADHLIVLSDGKIIKDKLIENPIDVDDLVW